MIIVSTIALKGEMRKRRDEEQIDIVTERLDLNKTICKHGYCHRREVTTEHIA